MKNMQWYQKAVFYELYVRAYYDSNGDGNGDLQGVIEKLDHIRSLGADCIWLLPIYPSPLKDDGYDISDYYDIHPSYGTLDDFKELLEEAHNRGIRIILDLVINHTSDQHKWFQEGRADVNSPYHDYYVWSDTKDKYAQARIIFLDVEESNWTWDAVAGKFFWHRFYSSQPDLNFNNPAVHEELFKVADFWLKMGVDGFRVDAVPYLYEREGTNCENLPETHIFLKKLRKFVDENYPNRVLICEANQWPNDVREYFGNGDEFHMGFNFPIMPRLYLALAKEDVTPIIKIVDACPEIPEDCQWCTFLRNHDELTLEMVTEEVRHFMWDYYAPQPRMRQNLGIRRRLAPLLDNDLKKIKLLNSILFTMPGTPVIYYGDDIGMGDNIWLEDRNGVRTPMQWTNEANGGFSSAKRTYLPVIDDEVFGYQKVNVEAQENDETSIYHFYQQLISIRKQETALIKGGFSWMPIEDKGVLAYIRSLDEVTVYLIHNMTSSMRTFQIGKSGKELINLLVGEYYQGGEPINLAPYDFLWLRAH